MHVQTDFPDQKFCMQADKLDLLAIFYYYNNVIMIFYCGLMVHITDTRTQKVVSYTSAHIAETVLAHD